MMSWSYCIDNLEGDQEGQTCILFSVQPILEDSKEDLGVCTWVVDTYHCSYKDENNKLLYPNPEDILNKDSALAYCPHLLFKGLKFGVVMVDNIGIND